MRSSSLRRRRGASADSPSRLIWRRRRSQCGVWETPSPCGGISPFVRRSLYWDARRRPSSWALLEHFSLDQPPFCWPQWLRTLSGTVNRLCSLPLRLCREPRALNMQIRYGFHIELTLNQPTTLVTLMSIHPSRRGDVIRETPPQSSHAIPIETFRYGYGNVRPWLTARV